MFEILNNIKHKTKKRNKDNALLRKDHPSDRKIPPDSLRFYCNLLNINELPPLPKGLTKINPLAPFVGTVAIRGNMCNNLVIKS